MANSDDTSSSFGSVSGRHQGSSRTFYVGIFLYLVSFFLPSVRYEGQFAPGWWCAFAALFAWTTGGLVNAAYQLGVRLTIFGCLLNLLAIAYVSLRLSRRALPTRLTVALTVLACIPPMWLSIYLLDAPPYFGHAAWISALVLMIFEDVSVLGRRNVLRIAAATASFALGLVCHGVIISRDPLAQGPSVWGLTVERSIFAGEPILWGLFREFPSKTDFHPLYFFASLLIDFMTWLVILFVTSKMMRVFSTAK
jgi:hypothetical protein